MWDAGIETNPLSRAHALCLVPDTSGVQFSQIAGTNWLRGIQATMVRPKPKRLWRPSELERRVGQTARLTAEKKALRIPWPQLDEAREKYVDWEAFVLWVRAIEHAEGGFPEWLAKIVDKRCWGFSKSVEKRSPDHSDVPPVFWPHLERWVNERIFGEIWREGWMNAVGYYAARDLASLRNHAYWEYCEGQWKRSKPAAYPSFQEWRKASERCIDQVLDECQMREEKRRLIKLSRRVSPRTLRQAVDRYMEWEVFAYWARTALESGCPLPASVERELKRACPGFLEVDAAVRAANPKEEPHLRFNRMIKWIEDHEFTNATKRGWFDVLLYQVRLHARHARVIDYWHDWEADWEKHSSPKYPSFAQWKKAADSYTFELDDG